MRNLKKLIVCVLTLGMVIAMSPVNMLAAENLSTEQWDLGAVHKGEDLILEGVNIQKFDNGYTCVTIEGTLHDRTENSRAIPEKEKERLFSHMIYNSSGVYMCTFYSLVTGVYDQTQNNAFLTSIEGMFDGPMTDGMGYGVVLNGSVGTVNIYCYTIYLGSFTYTIATNGTISNI